MHSNSPIKQQSVTFAGRLFCPGSGVFNRALSKSSTKIMRRITKLDCKKFIGIRNDIVLAGVRTCDTAKVIVYCTEKLHICSLRPDKQWMQMKASPENSLVADTPIQVCGNEIRLTFVPPR